MEYPLKFLKSGTDVTALSEFEDGDLIPMQFVEFPHDYISGLYIRWVSGTEVHVDSGQAYIPSVGTAIRVASPIELDSLSLSSNTWYHVYVYDDNGTPSAEIVTTVPDTPYLGTARTKQGDNSRRYVGSVLTNGSGNIYNMKAIPGNVVLYRCPTGTGTPFRVLTGMATSYTTVSCSGAVPVTAVTAQMKLAAPSGAVLRTTTPDASDTSGPPSFNSLFAIPSGLEQYVLHPLDSLQRFAYWCDAGTPSSNAGAYVTGYIYER